MRHLGSRRSTTARSTRVIAACLLVVVVVAGVLGGVHGIDVVTAPTTCILLADLSASWLPRGGADDAPRPADVAPLLPPRAPPVPRSA
jgi:hypothetical protein